MKAVPTIETEKVSVKGAQICFVSPFAYGAIAGSQDGHLGGVERQTALMGRWLADRGHRVSVITWDEGQADGVQIDGMTIYRMCRKNAGVKGLRFIWPKWTSLVAAMKRAEAQVYYQNCGEYVTGQVALWCRRQGRRFVYSVARDPDCDARLPEMHKRRERVLYRYGLGRADRVIVQTRRQQEMLRSGFGREAAVIPMPCPGPSSQEYDRFDGARSDSHRVLWIGRICEVKRPDRLLDIAQACPDLQIDFVGPASETEYARNVYARALTLPNVVVHGPATRARVEEFYRAARVLCCTSDFEGFPNTFLEAWSWGVPVVSTCDPDHLIAARGLGRFGTEPGELVRGIRELLDAPEQWRQASRSARAYYVSHHALDSAMEQFERVFCELAGSTGAPQRGVLRWGPHHRPTAGESL